MKLECGHGEGFHHNCTYITHRERLIPYAEEKANRIHGRELHLERGQDNWNRIFHAEMDRLANLSPVELARFLKQYNALN
jgi:hypothetical protein